MDNTGNRKSSAAPAIIVLILALFTAVGVRTFLGPCVHDDGTFGACHWAGQALFGLSLVVAAEAAAAAVLGGAGVRRGLYIAVLLSAVLGLLIPGTLISLCGMATMRCRALMRPAMMILCALMGVSAAAGIILSGEKKK